MDKDSAPLYESPAKKELEGLLAKHGKHLSPAVLKQVERAIADIDHTNPAEVMAQLPESVLDVYRTTLTRAVVLTPLIAKAHDAGCFIESIILSHGLIQFALRALYALSWQRAVLPQPLTETDLASYYKQGARRGNVFALVNDLRHSGVIFDHHADLLLKVNDARNKAAHGVIFGEMEIAELHAMSEKSQYAALGALDTLRVWFNNPKPLNQPPPLATGIKE